MNGFTRRQFLKGTAATGTLMTMAALAGCSNAIDAGGTSATETADSDAPILHATSSIFGTADTGNKSTLKKTLLKTEGPGDIDIYHYDETGARVKYPDGTQVDLPSVTYTGYAELSLGEDVDNSKIDSSNATVELAPGDGYYTDELTLSADKLDGSWSGGTYLYTLDVGDLTWNMGDYPQNDPNSSREWSCFGGDGNGCYTFNLVAKGIKYDGKELDPVTFPVQVYIWGRDATDMAQKFNDVADPVAAQAVSGLSQTSDTQWTWVGDGDLPVLCDDQADNFYVVWPSGTDASAIGQGNVSVTLHSQYGDELKLSDEQYTVFSSASETQIAVTYMNWPYTPVYTTLSIDISYAGLTASHTFDVASVYVYLVQQGGGGVTVDGTITAYSFYGFDHIDNFEQVMNHATYALTTGEGDSMQYFVGDGDEGTLTSNKDEATQFDASGADECNQQVVANTALITTRVDQTAEKTVDGSSVTLNKTYNTRGVTKDAQGLRDSGLKLLPGYAIPDDLLGHQMWAWQNRFLAGYTPDKPEPTSFPYTTFPYGF